jgi:hypothetical protein
MFEIIQEQTLPMLSKTSLYDKFNQSSEITKNVIDEIKHSKETQVKPDNIKEILSLIKLNGDVIAKKAVTAFEKGDIIIINNKETSKIPTVLPYIVISQGNSPKAFVFADKVVNNINSSQEYTSLMATIEAAYLALSLQKKQNNFTLNRPLMLTLCNIYALMVTTPLEQKLYMKGDNLVKAMIYVVTYFYKMIDGDDVLSAASLKPICKRIIYDKIEDSMITQIVEEVKAMPDMSFMSLIELIKNINPIRYKDLDTMYLTYFTSTCGISLMFALENISYLFLLITSANYKTSVTAYGLNKVVNMPVKKAITLLSSINNF